MILEVAAAMTVFTFGPTLLGVHFARGIKIGKLGKLGGIKNGAMMAALSPRSEPDSARDVCDSP